MVIVRVIVMIAKGSGKWLLKWSDACRNPAQVGSVAFWIILLFRFHAMVVVYESYTCGYHRGVGRRKQFNRADTPSFHPESLSSSVPQGTQSYGAAPLFA